MLRSTLIPSVLSLAAAAFLAVPSQADDAQVEKYPVPKAAVTLPAELDPITYQAASTCSPTPKPGVAAFRALVLATYPGTGDSGIVRACAAGGESEHKEGRAWDWRVSALSTKETAEANTLLAWLTAADSANRTGAMARRLGIMYIIWNDHIWSPSRAAEGWRNYVHPSCRTVPLAKCGTTLRHRDHVHFSFTWPGANKQTSFWTGVVATTTTTGPAPSPRPAPKPAPNPASKPAPKPASKTASKPAPTRATPAAEPTALTGFYGRTVRPGQTSAAVKALQKALRMAEVTGYYGPKTKAATVAFQKAKRLAANGVVSRPTWTALQQDINRGASRIRTVRTITVRPGARHVKAVPVLETALRRPADAVYDAKTVASVKAFQRVHRLPVTGVVNPATWQALSRL